MALSMLHKFRSRDVSLCERCDRSMKWHSLLNGKLSGMEPALYSYSPQEELQSMGFVDSILSNASTCSFCELLSQLWEIVSSSQAHDAELSKHTECFISKDGIPRINPLSNGFLMGSVTRYDLILAKVRFTKPYTLRTDHSKQLILPRAESNKEQADPLRRIYLSYPDRRDSTRDLRTRSEQEVSDGLLNISLIKTWLGFCALHRRCNRARQASRLRSLRLINVIDRTIVEAPHSTRYLALSYVWGDLTRYPGHSGAAATVSHSTNNSASPLPPNIPQTIEDACQLTYKLGEQYLWVDVFCIDQKNHIKRAEQIIHMDEIYEGAMLTIVAASGTTSHAGIAGVSRPLQEIAQPTVKTPLGPVQATFWRTLQDSFEASPWNHRAWTLQEGALSTRVLFITDHNYTMRCRKGVYLDILHPYDQPDESTAVGDLFNGTVFLMEWYINAITQYTRRSLSDPSDVLKALSGMFSRIHRNNGVSFYWGLPKNDCFIPALLWHRSPSSAALRRENFPSWSWCGLEGEISYFKHPRFDSGKDSRKDACAGFTIPVGTTSVDSRVQLNVQLFRVAFEVNRGHATPLVTQEMYLDSTDQETSLGAQEIYLDYPHSWKNGDYIRDAALLQQTFVKFSTGDVASVRMGQPEYLFYLLLERKGSSWQRIGVAKLRSTKHEYNMSDGQWIGLE